MCGGKAPKTPSTIVYQKEDLSRAKQKLNSVMQG